MKFELITVSPEIARQWLDTNADNNRNISPQLVKKLAADIIRDKWRLTGEVIKFDSEGRLIDGQHRLSAVIASKKTVQMHVVRDLPPETMYVIDTGKSRSAGDALKIAGLNGFSNDAAALARKIIAFQAGSQNVLDRKQIRLKGQPITNADIVEFCGTWDITEHCRFAANLKYHQIGNTLTQGEYAFFHWYFGQVDLADAEKFLTAVATLDGVGAESPIRTLVNKIKHSEGLTSQMRLYATVITWNAWRKKEPLPVIRVGRLENEPSMPRAV